MATVWGDSITLSAGMNSTLRGVDDCTPSGRGGRIPPARSETRRPWWLPANANESAPCRVESTRESRSGHRGGFVTGDVVAGARPSRVRVSLQRQ